MTSTSSLSPMCVLVIFIFHFPAYASSLPASALPHLEQQLDWNDLIEIAHHMLDWEEKLCTHLGLTAVQSSQQL